MNDNTTFDGYDEIMPVENDNDNTVPDEYDSMFTGEPDPLDQFDIPSDDDLPWENKPATGIENALPISDLSFSPEDILAAMTDPKNGGKVQAITPQVEQMIADAPEQTEEQRALEKHRHEVDNGWDSEDIDIPSDWFTSEPKPREYIIDRFIPRNIVGIISSKGGVGKSMLSLQLSIAISGGEGDQDFFGMNIVGGGKVLLLSAEDDRDECWRRIKAMRNAMENKKEFGSVNINWDKVLQNLKIKSLVGDNVRLTKPCDVNKNDVVTVYDTINKITRTMNREGGYTMVIIDTYSRFNGGKENSNEDSAAFIKACEIIKKETGATVMVLAHARKGSRGEADSTAGGGRFIDSARWAATLHPYLEDFDEDLLGMSSQEKMSHVRFSVTKDNYSGLLGASLYMKRDKDVGVLLPSSEMKIEKGKPGRPTKTETDVRSEVWYRSAITEIKDVIFKAQCRNNHLTARKIRDQYAGQNGPLKSVSQSRVNQAIRAAISDGEIIEFGTAKGGGCMLKIPDQ